MYPQQLDISLEKLLNVERAKVLDLVTKITDEDITDILIDLKEAFDDQKEFTRQANVAYAEILKLWGSCMEANDELRRKLSERL